MTKVLDLVIAKEIHRKPNKVNLWTFPTNVLVLYIVYEHMWFLFPNFICICFMVYECLFTCVYGHVCMYVWSPELMWRIISHCFSKTTYWRKVSQWRTDFTHRVSLSLGSPVTAIWDTNYRSIIKTSRYLFTHSGYLHTYGACI